MFRILIQQVKLTLSNSEIPFYTSQNGYSQKPKGQQMLSRMWSKGTLLHCWWEYKLVLTTLATIWQFLRKVEIILPQDPAIPLLGIYSKDTPFYHKDTCSTVFIAPLFIIAKI